MWHPFLFVETEVLGWLFAFLALASIILLMRIAPAMRRLRNSTAPLGLVSLGMSLSPEESESIIDSWSEDRRDEARSHLSTDYLLIPVYTTALAVLGVLASRWFAMKGMPRMSQLAIWLAWGQWIIGLLDVAENSALLRILQMHPEIPDSMTRMASAFSRFKVFLILAAIMATFFFAVAGLQ